MAPTKHVAMRSCAVCGDKRPKRELTRIVRTPQGAVVVDQSGKVNGRGAYLCARSTCWQAAAQGKRLEQTLKAVLAAADKARIAEYAPAVQT